MRRKAKFFARGDWTTQISLKSLANSRFWRTSFSEMRGQAEGPQSLAFSCICWTAINPFRIVFLDQANLPVAAPLISVVEIVIRGSDAAPQRAADAC